MGLIERVVISLALLLAAMSPISASGDMSGCPGGDCSGGSISGESSSTIVVEYSGGEPGEYHPSSPGSFSTGYRSPAPGGITLGYNRPMAGDTSSGKPTDPDSITQDILSGISSMSQDLDNKYTDYSTGKLSGPEFVNYCTDLDWKLKNIKSSLESLQGLVKDASQTAQGVKEAGNVEQQNPYIPGSSLLPEPKPGFTQPGSGTQQGSGGSANPNYQPSSNSNTNSGASGGGSYN